MSRAHPGDRVRAALDIPWRGDYPHPTIVMGVVNVTPDSFQPEGRHPEPVAATAHARLLLAEGADILDVGGESTRPGSSPVTAREEIARVAPVIRALASTGAPISVDTRKSEVAAAALDAGARIVNDISAGAYDPRLLKIVAERDAFLCLMHSPLDPSEMAWSTGANPAYADVVADVRDALLARVDSACRAGVRPERIWIDPGFGFGKTVDDNLRLLRGLGALVETGYPVVIGASRKSTLGRVLGGVAPEDRVFASVAAMTMAQASRVAVARVHDVRASVWAARTADAILHPGHGEQR